MSIVRLNKKQFSEAISLSEYAFQYSVDSGDYDEYLHKMGKHEIFGVYDEGKLAAKLHILPFHIYIGQNKLKMGGIGGVATYPEFRRKGYAKQLLHHSLRVMQAAGTSISMLYPFSIPFYRKAGWEVFSDRMTCQFTRHDLIPFNPEPTGVVRRYTKDTHSIDIETVYDAWSSQHSGMIVRDHEWWLDHYHNRTAAVYYDEHSHPQGYMLYEIKNNAMHVHEFMCVTRDSRQGLWNYICQHDSMLEQVNMRLCENERLFFALNLPRIVRTIQPFVMARIVDITLFLQQYTFAPVPAHPPLSLYISDDQAPWNNVVIQFENGQAAIHSQDEKQVLTTVNMTNTLSMNIRALTTMLLGYQRPCELFDNGFIAGSINSIETLEQFVPRLHPYISDAF